MAETSSENSTTMNASTYKQVVENLKKLSTLSKAQENLTTKLNNLADTVDDMSTNMGDLEDLPMTVKEMGDIVQDLSDQMANTTGSSSLSTTDDGEMKVIGTHANTEKADENTKPSEYNQGLTMELKSTAAIGLDKETNISKKYVFVLTLIQDNKLKSETSVDATEYTPMQIAYADKSATPYIRAAVDSSTWGDWITLEIPEVEIPEVVNQVIVSEEQPTDQPEGHFWAEPLDSAPYVPVTVSEEEPAAEEQVNGDYWAQPINYTDNVNEDTTPATTESSDAETTEESDGEEGAEQGEINTI